MSVYDDLMREIEEMRKTYPPPSSLCQNPQYSTDNVAELAKAIRDEENEACARFIDECGEVVLSTQPPTVMTTDTRKVASASVELFAKMARKMRGRVQT